MWSAKTVFSSRVSILALALAAPAVSLGATVGLATSAVFDEVVAGPDSVYAGAGSAYLQWGDTQCTTCETYTSYLGFEGPGNLYKPVFEMVETGSPFLIGTLSFSNVTRGGDSANVSYAEMLLGLQVQDGVRGDFVFDLNIANTPDDSNQKHGVPDVLTVGSNFDSYHFSHAGQVYTLGLLGWSADGGSSFADLFSVPELEKIKIGLYAQAQPVPVPAAFWLFGSGLLALAGTVRRRSN
ncbi:MAG: choice-of-anchor K domain-containing protein [Gammaproteobacteria bacterium]